MQNQQPQPKSQKSPAPSSSSASSSVSPSPSPARSRTGSTHSSSSVGRSAGRSTGSSSGSSSLAPVPDLAPPPTSTSTASAAPSPPTSSSIAEVAAAAAAAAAASPTPARRAPPPYDSVRQPSPEKTTTTTSTAPVPIRILQKPLQVHGQQQLQQIQQPSFSQQLRVLSVDEGEVQTHHHQLQRRTKMAGPPAPYGGSSWSSSSGLFGSAFGGAFPTVPGAAPHPNPNLKPSTTTSQSDGIVGMLEKNGDTIQQVALLAYLTHGEQAKPFLQGVTAAKLCYQAYKHLSKADEVDLLRQETIHKVAAYVKEHPRARPVEIQAKVEEEVLAFRSKLKALGY